MELIYEQGTPEFRGQWPRVESMLELAAPRPGSGDWPHPALELAPVRHRRERTDAWGAIDDQSHSSPVPPGVLHDNPAGRVAALDDAGVALQLINPGPSIDACLGLPSNLASGVFAAYNRYIVAYCREDPQRLGAVLQLHGSEPRWSAQEVDELHREPSVRAVSICLPVRISPDDRQFEPLWDALERSGLPLLHRPTLCSRIWGPGRLLGYLRAAGVLDRHPGLRIAFAAGDAASSACELTRAAAAAAAADVGLGSRLFTAVTASQLRRGYDDAAAMLWASDFPLRGELRSELQSAGSALGTYSEDVLVGGPERFLSGGSDG
jgi:hypothetical protein